MTILRGGTSNGVYILQSDLPDADVDYTFAQVSVDKPLVSYKGNCGSISSGVGPFPIEKGLVEPKEGLTTVRIYNTNTDKIIEADIVTHEGCVEYDGDFAIAGVPGTANLLMEGVAAIRPYSLSAKKVLP